MTVAVYQRYPLQTTDELLERVQPLLGRRGYRIVSWGCSLADKAHAGQLRKDGITPFIQHPLGVAWIIVDEMNLGHIWFLIFLAIMHDVLEDSTMLHPSPHRRYARYRLLLMIFGLRLGRALLLLSQGPKQSREDYVRDFRRWTCMRFLLVTGWWAGGWAVPLVKLADRLNNLRTLDVIQRDKQLKKVAETECLYLSSLESNEGSPCPDSLVSVLRRRLPSSMKHKADYLGDQLTGMCELIKQSPEWSTALVR